jgi:hypothetical protein
VRYYNKSKREEEKMKKSLLNKFIASALLVLILALSATATASNGKSSKIIASAVGSGTISPSGKVGVKIGESQTFTFDPETGFHISSIVVDGAYVSSYRESYTFDIVNGGEYHTITVTFSKNDEPTEVPSGDDVTIFLDPAVTLTLDVTASGVATLNQFYFPNGVEVKNVWQIENTALFDIDKAVLIALIYDPSELGDTVPRLIRGDSRDAVCSDVNNDLVVDGTDVSIVANAVKQQTWYEPSLDVNKDGFVNEDDVHVVNENRGATLTDITYKVYTDPPIILGITDHFSLFRAH